MIRSSFPEGVDVFEEKLDPTPSEIADIRRWQSLQGKANKTLEEATEYQELTTRLAAKILTAEDYNRLASAVTATQSFFVGSTEEFVADLQNGAERIMEHYTASFLHRGPYNPSTNYVPGNVVSYQGSSYQNTTACKGILPTTSTHWALVSSIGNKGEKGDKGDDGFNLIYKGQYDSTESYTTDHLVTYNGTVYHCIRPATGVNPMNGTYWEIAVEKGESTVVKAIRSKSHSIPGVAEVQIGITNFSSSSDSLLVFADGKLLTPGEDYTIADNSKIFLVDTTQTKEMEFVVNKNVVGSTNYAFKDVKNVRVPADNWTFTSKGNVFKILIQNPSINGGVKIDAIFSGDNLEKAQGYGVMPYTMEVPEGVELYSTRKPEEDLIVDLAVWTPSEAK